MIFESFWISFVINKVYIYLSMLVNSQHLLWHQFGTCYDTWGDALDGCVRPVSRGRCGFILLLTWRNFSLHRPLTLLLKTYLSHLILHIWWEKGLYWGVKHNFITCVSDACFPTLVSEFLLVSAASSLFFHMLFPFWKRLRIWASSDSRSWNESGDFFSV